MKLTSKDVQALREAFNVCRVASIDAVVITEGQIRGITADTKMAILSPIELSIDADVKIGVGRIGELEKRLGIFGQVDIEIDCKLNDANEVVVLTPQVGKTKVQFRCTAERMIKYPKTNDDDPICTIKMSKDEAQQISRAVKTLGAETVTLAIGREAGVKFECSSSANELFSTEIDAEASFENDPQAIVHIYQGDRLASVIDAAVRDQKELEIIVGDFGSLILVLNGHLIVAMPESNMENDDE